jgi:hypothetical protein
MRRNLFLISAILFFSVALLVLWVWQRTYVDSPARYETHHQFVDRGQVIKLSLTMPEYKNHVHVRLISVDHKNKSAIIEVFDRNKQSWKQCRGIEGEMLRDKEKQPAGVWLERADVNEVTLGMFTGP